MKFKKVFAGVLSAAMLVSVAACGTPAATEPTATTEPAPVVAEATPAPGDTTEATPAPTDEAAAPTTEGLNPLLSPDKPVTLTTWITTSNTEPAPGNKIADLITKDTGVTIQYQLVTPDNVDQSIGVMLAGGEYPDLVATTDQKLRLLEGGALLRLDDMVMNTDNYPNLKEFVGPYLKKMSYSGTVVPAGLYIFSNYNRFFGDITAGTYYGAGFFIQKRVLEDQNYPDLTNMTLDKYFGMLEDYLAKNPQTEGQATIGFESGMPTGTEWILTNPAALIAGSPNNGGVIVDSNNVATIYADKDSAKTWFKKLNEEYSKGVVDPESFSQTNDQMQSKIATGRVLGLHDQLWQFQNAINSLYSANQPQYTYVATEPTLPGVKPYYADRDVMNLQQGFGVSVSSKQPEIALAFLDTMTSEYWQKILSWGIEGEDYSVGADGMFTRNDEQRANSRDLTWRASNKVLALWDNLPKHAGSFSDGNAYSPDDQPAEFYATLVDYDKAFLKAYNKQTWRQFLLQPPDNAVYYPAWQITLSADGNEVNQQMTDTNTSMLPSIVIDDPANFETNWAAYVAAYGKINVKLYEDEINAGIQQRIAEWQ